MLQRIATLVICLGVLLGSNLTQAIEIDKQDNPISFTLEVLPWEIVDNIIPRKSIFTIIDVETGKHFNVQRRAGSSHADVQPVTRKDTKIMKEIYNGKWSWKRRAIIVLTGDNMIAASMHGMPHGAGAIRNGFPGHFCVHFIDSKTHKSKNANLAHKLMIVKAAGQLKEYIYEANPYELIQTFTEGINQTDKKILELTVSQESLETLLEKTKDIEQIKARIIEDELSKEELESLVFLEIPVELKMYTKGIGKDVKVVNFVLERTRINERWIVNGESVYNEL